MKPILFTLAIVLAGTSTAFCQDAEKYTQDIIQRDGVFYPSHTIAGKAYYGGTWYEAEDVTSPNARWRTSLEELAQLQGYETANDLAYSWGYVKYPADVTAMANSYGYANMEEWAADWGYLDLTNATADIATFLGWYGYADIESLAASYGYENPQDFISSWGYNTLEELVIDQGAYTGGVPDPIGFVQNYWGYNTAEEMALQWGYGTPDPDSLLNAYGGISTLAANMGIPLEKSQLSTAEKGSLLDAIYNGTLTSEDYNALLSNTGYIYENYLFKTDGVYDAQFANKLIATLKETNNPHLQDAYENLGRSLTANNTGIGETDLSGWETPNLTSFPINQSNLTWDQINSATNLSYANMSGMDVSEWNPPNTLNRINLSNTNVTGSQLNQSSNLSGINLQGTNIAGFSASGKNISYIDFNQVGGITGANLAGATNMQNVNLRNLDMAGFTPGTSTSFYSANFSQTTNFSGTMLNSTGSLQYINVSGKNLTGLNTNNRSMANANLSNTTGITAAQIAQASNIRNMNLSGTGITKAALDAALIAAGKNTSSSNFNTNTITF